MSDCNARVLLLSSFENRLAVIQAHRATLLRSRRLCVQCTPSLTTLTTASPSHGQSLRATWRRLQQRPTPSCHSQLTICRWGFICAVCPIALLPFGMSRLSCQFPHDIALCVQHLCSACTVTLHHTSNIFEVLAQWLLSRGGNP